eukprot:tig00000194_g14726.t1
MRRWERQFPRQEPAKKAPTNGQEKPTKAEVKEAKEKLKGPPEFPKGPKPLYEDVSPGEIFVAMRPTKQGKKGGDKKDGKEDKAKTDKISKATLRRANEGLASRFAPATCWQSGGGDSHITPFESEKYARFQQMAKTALHRSDDVRRIEDRQKVDKLAEVEAQAIANAYYINKFKDMEQEIDGEYEEGFRAWLMGQSAFTSGTKALGPALRRGR